MWKAVNILKEQGLLTSFSRRGTILGREVPSPTFPPLDGEGDESPHTIWQHVHSRIKRDILRGEFRSGQPLPSIKELRHRYRTSPPTLTKAIKSLIREGLVIPSWNSLTLPLPAAPQGSRIILLLDSSYPGQTKLENDRQRELMRSLEIACRRSGAALDIIRFGPADGDTRRSDSPGAGSPAWGMHGDTLGYIVWSYYNADNRQDLLRRVLPLRMPVSLIDEIGMTRLPTGIPARGELRIFRLGVSITPGVEVARHLLALGHRTIAYVSPYHGAEWSRQRLAGLEKIYHEAGYHDAVRVVTIDTTVSHVQYYTSSTKRYGTDRLIGSFVRWVRPFSDELGPRLEPHVIRYIREECAYSEVSVHLQPLLENAARDAAVTAWVAAEDRTADFVGRFLLRKGLKIGEDVSLIGFDDSPLAAEKRLTSYNFGITSIVDAAVRHILNPAAFRKLTRETFIEVPGVIVERQSTGRARTEQLGDR
jgi:hypothetical protein